MEGRVTDPGWAQTWTEVLASAAAASEVGEAFREAEGAEDLVRGSERTASGDFTGAEGVVDHQGDQDLAEEGQEAASRLDFLPY